MAYSNVVFLLDVGPSMSEEVFDEETGRTVTKLDLAKEYVCRKISPKVQSGRKTEHTGVLTFGGATDNPFFAKTEDDKPEAEAHDPQDYVGVASIFPPQQARPQMLGVVQSIRPGEFNGNPMAALIVLDKILEQHLNNTRASKNWKREAVILTHAQAKVKQVGWEVVLGQLAKRGVALRVIGLGFDPRPSDKILEDEFSQLPKVERFWRKFCDHLYDTVSTEDAHLCPSVGSLMDALSTARGPVLDGSKSILSKSVFRIGEKSDSPEQAIEVPIRYSKATSLARPQSLKKVIASQVARPKILSESITASQSQVPRTSQSNSQIQSAGTSTAAGTSGIAGIEADVSAFTKYYVVQKKNEQDEDVEMGETSEGDRRIEDADGEDEGEYEEMEVDIENCTKAYRFGSTWVPLNEEDFETMPTKSGIEVLGFIKETGLKRYQEMGEVLYIWPDPDDTKSQIIISAVVQAMESMSALGVFRYVNRDGGNPKLGFAKPMYYDGEMGRIECLHWVQLPFAEDERNFFFPSLKHLKSKSGKPIEEHPLLATEEQISLMSDLVDEMDLDPLGDPETGPWYDCADSFNPAIHRLREVIYHLAVTADLNSDPVPPPHPKLVKYIEPPAEIIEKSKNTVKKLAEALNIKAAPPPKKKFERKPSATDARDDLDIDALFAKGSTSPTRVKEENTEDVNGKQSGAMDAYGASSSKRSTTTGSNDRVIGNQDPIGDFTRVVSESSGNELMEKAMADLGEVVKENLTNSFSTSGFKKALECLQVMRKQAMTYEMTDEYNRYIRDLERFVTDPSFKHTDFWKHVEEAIPRLGEISDEEADAALAAQE